MAFSCLAPPLRSHGECLVYLARNLGHPRMARKEPVLAFLRFRTRFLENEPGTSELNFLLPVDSFCHAAQIAFLIGVPIKRMLKRIPGIPIFSPRLFVPLQSGIQVVENSVLVHDDRRARRLHRPQFDPELLTHHSFRLANVQGKAHPLLLK